ncbi:MAG: 16S rRNA (cytidine(1402)-2'-O)-methyltransferase [Gracilibacteraceae bacterium]|jgi:16S rRNA (cytidine1402-2'-O)-methyltransferase|nr:16S rRNA (cytidine(1402)-2'-O)-methyltransferase [Gracilibacteraceae bacterium]
MAEAGGEAAPAGALYVCATPIGNLEDITLRVLRVLREADLIAAEDTRHTRKLLARYEIDTPLVSYREHNERRQSEALLRALLAGKNVALVSDAGLPCISDPGAVIVRTAAAAGIRVDVLPGPSAGLTALVLSGLPAERFIFLGFLPAARSARGRELDELEGLPYTLIFYEAPHRLAATLGDMAARWPERRAAVTRELTKLHQEVCQGTLRELAQRFAAAPARGECCLLLAPVERTPAPPPAAETVLVRLRELTAAGLSGREARAQIAAEYGLGKKELYRLWLTHAHEKGGG